MNAKAVSDKPNVPGCGRGCMFVFGSVFLLVGAGAFWLLFLSPALKSWSARKWPQAPCVILSSSVKTHSDSDGDTYSPDIRYRYSLDGGEFIGDQYSFFTASVGGTWAHSIVDQYPVGSNSVCYYNPANPSEAVLNPALNRPAYFGLLLLIFVATGIGIIGYAIWGKSTVKSTTPLISIATSFEADRFRADNDATAFEGPQKLKPVESRMGKAIGIGIFSLIWNGILSFFVFDLFNGAAWFQFLIMIPFIAVGIGTILATIYQFLALLNPKVEVALSNGAVPLGQAIDVAWQLRGRVSRLRKLSVVVEGTEHATYTRGTSTYTDKETFCKIELQSSSDPQEMEFGTRTLQVPADTMHTFKAAKNKIIWTIRVHGEIPWWPDVNDAFEFFVKPRSPK